MGTRESLHPERAPVILNLGCGTKTSNHCVNIDWSPYLWLKRTPVVRAVVPLLLDPRRRARYRELSDSIVAHDLRRGIPFGDESVDAVYHCHVLEHIDRDAVPGFLREIRRVLRPRGIHRIVVPDFGLLARRYVQGLVDQVDMATHQTHIEDMIEQMVRKQAAGTQQQRPLRRMLERAVLGDARRRGETHQWMYDQATLPALLLAHGFADPTILGFDESAISNWKTIALDTDDAGNQYKPDSLYVECRRPTGDS